MANTLAHLLLQYHSPPVLNTGQLAALPGTSLYKYVLYSLWVCIPARRLHGTCSYRLVLASAALTIKHTPQSCKVKQHINFFNEKCFLLVSHICRLRRFSNLMLHCKIFRHYKAQKQYHRKK